MAKKKRNPIPVKFSAPKVKMNSKVAAVGVNDKVAKVGINLDVVKVGVKKPKGICLKGKI